MDFHLFRVFLSPRAQQDLFAKRTGDDRENWLRTIFGEEIRFVHRRKEFVFVPDINANLEGLIVGKVGRRRTVKENEPPEKGFHETAREQWRAAWLILDPSTHEDGQKIALEYDGAVGRPDAVITALFKSVNGREPPEPFRAEVNPIADPDSFWEFVSANKGAVTSVTFHIVMPNMFGGKDDFEEEMRSLRDNNAAKTANLNMQNPDGLRLEDDKKIREAVEYTTRGGGRVRAKAKGKPKYDSRNRVKRVAITPPEQPSAGENQEEVILTTVFDAIFKR